MRIIANRAASRAVSIALFTAIALPAGSLAAQQQLAPDPTIVVSAELPPLSSMSAGPEIKGTITRRTTDRMQVTSADGTNTTVAISDATRIKDSSGLFGGSRIVRANALLNGLPVTVKTLQYPGGLAAGEITFKNKDYKFAQMIRNGTDQRFGEQAAATEALRSRVGDIDNYNVKSTTNVYFATGQANLTEADKADLCTAASTAEGMNNALLLVVGYTDATGGDEINQTLSEKRATSVIHYLQQVCHWKPYRMLTPTGMAKADPLADNDTVEGRARNRRVAVNVLVSKAVDGF